MREKINERARGISLRHPPVYTTLILLTMLGLAAPALVQAQFTFITNNGAITITEYTGTATVVAIPSMTNSLPVTTIGVGAFYNCTNVTEVTIPDSVTNIGYETFGFCTSLGSVTLGTGITSVGDMAFAYCSRLSSVALPGSLISIGTEAFESCMSLSSITIPGNVTNIGAAPFLQCSSLTAINVAGNNSAYMSASGILFNKNQSVLIEYPQAKSGASYTIPNAVTSIASNAFYSCLSLTSITIDTNVSTISYAAFSRCSGLKRIAIPTNVTYIPQQAFEFCVGLTNVTMGNYVTNIDNSAFLECLGLTSVTIPNGLINVGTIAFEGVSLTNVTFGSSLASLGDYAFVNCAKLESAYFAGNAPSADCTVFSGDNLTIFYLPGTAGWGSGFACMQVAPWTLPWPTILSGSPGFGLQSNVFGFNVSWATNLSVVVEACTNLPNGSWQPLQTNSVASQGWFYFGDTTWSNYPSRFYRARSL